ncbi:hypothetical protein GLOTRDRAFT_128466 [Gloeophyllum trabeum ATCC 11539]|uniref:Uncharacterized protein n=1 Tax=Gloeophyllum trabeum (strain ATCC 11539 / FP-39264 / Madison 617) TaxID=670483 RepID=S7RTQ5_GLOTA|nr:uncharacterized protein GLOTRDRAFT_128466 [Gloeophyllum trabeum ATCC 11539]EPQ56524.1 hypothetical protein GLOTRDRAFT_128466 [Gloeophyllum trabeum ATCC 11539]
MDPSKAVHNDENPTQEELAWRHAVEDLDAQMKHYERAKETGNKAAEQEESRKLVEAMNRIAERHPDPRVQEEWRAKAQAFSAGNEAEKQSILRDVGKGVAVLLTVPFALVGGAVFATGAVIYGAGNVVKGVGNVLTGGAFQKSRGRANSRT